MPVSHIKVINTTLIPDWSGAVTVANSTGGTQAANGSDLVRPTDWNSAHTLQLTGSEIASLFSAEHRVTISTGAGGLTFGLDNDIGFFEPNAPFAGSTTAAGNATWYIDPIQLPGALNSGHLRQILIFGSSTANSTSNNSNIIFGFGTSTFSTGSTGGVTKSATIYNRMALFLRGDGTASTRLSSMWSNEDQFQFSAVLSVSSSASSQIGAAWTIWASYPAQWDSLGNETYSTVSGSVSSSTAVSSMACSKLFTLASLSAIHNLFTGGFVVPMGLASRISAGEWYLGFNHQVSTGSAAAGGGYTAFGMASSVSKFILTENSSLNSLYRMMGQTITNSSTYVMPGHGWVSASVSTCPATIGLGTDSSGGGANLVNTNTQYRHYWNYQKYI